MPPAHAVIGVNNFKYLPCAHFKKVQIWYKKALLNNNHIFLKLGRKTAPHSFEILSARDFLRNLNFIASSAAFLHGLIAVS